MADNGDTRAREPRYRQPFVMNGKRQIINPGSIGQPRDQNPDAAYAMLDLEANTFEHRRIPYDIPDVQKRMRSYGLPERLVTRLEHGW
jgi:diadenosine tetraphosphatase ApaH/serine/threonine PP2A family protein phosphatase